MPQTAIPKPLASIDHAADQICLIIAAERADASEPVLHHLKQVQIQFDSFRASVDATRAAQVVMVAKAERKAAHLAKILDGLLSTLREAGIFHFQGRLAFGKQWSSVVPGFASTDARNPALLAPKEVLKLLESQTKVQCEVVGALSAALQEHQEWRLAHDVQSAPSERQSSPVSEIRCNIDPPTLKNSNRDTLSLKRPIEADAPESAAKRSRSLEVPSFTESSNTDDTRFVAASPTPSPPSPVSDISERDTGHSYPHKFASPRHKCSEGIPATPLRALPVIERWRGVFAPAETSQDPPRYPLPPLLSFVNAHSCTYYTWFILRSFLFRRLGEPQFAQENILLTAEEWKVQLHGKHWHEAEALEHLCPQGGVQCSSNFNVDIFRKHQPVRSDGTPFTPADFASHAVQAFMCADLELAQAKIQFEQTDDLLLGTASWTAQQRASRDAARRDVFRNSWSLSFASSPLESAEVVARRPWIVRFCNMLRDWPGFSSTGTLSSHEDLESLDPDTLVAYELQLIAFYLKTVHSALRVAPAMPRTRPEIDALPILSRSLFSTSLS